MNKNNIPRWYPIFDLMIEKEPNILKEKVTNKELFLLYLVHKIRCISPKELSRLFNESIQHSLIALRRAEEKGYLYSEQTTFYGCTQRVFFTTNDGVEKIAELLNTDLYRFDKELDKYVPNYYSQTENKISENHIPHFLATNDFYLTLLKNGISVDWQDSRYNALFEGDLYKAPIRVDGSYVVNNNFYGIEQDMGTTSRQRLISKLTTYANYFPISNFDNSTIYFSINMAKDISLNRFKVSSEAYIFNAREIDRFRKKKRKYTEVKKLIKKDISSQSIEELKEEEKAIKELLNNPVLSRWEKRRQSNRLAEIEKLINKEPFNFEYKLKAYQQIIDNPLITPSEKRRAEIQKEIILTYKEVAGSVDVDKKIRDLTLKMRVLNKDNREMEEDKEREVLIKSAHQRRDRIYSYIDYQIHNTESDNTLLDLFRKGVNMYVDETISLANFAAKQLKEITMIDHLTTYIEEYFTDFLNQINNIIGFDISPKVKYDNFAFTIDYGIKMYRSNKEDTLVYIDIFDICDNNIASYYRLNEYMKEKRDNRRFFTNRIAICLIDSDERLDKMIVDYKYDLSSIWFYKENKEDIVFNNMVHYQESKIEKVQVEKELSILLKQIIR